jgi:hypothetical protein
MIQDHLRLTTMLPSVLHCSSSDSSKHHRRLANVQVLPHGLEDKIMLIVGSSGTSGLVDHVEVVQVFVIMISYRACS